MTNKDLPADIDDRYERHFDFLIDFARERGEEYKVYSLLISRGRYYDIMRIMAVDRARREPIQKFLDDLLDTRFDEPLCKELQSYFTKIVSDRHKIKSETDGEGQSLKAGEEK